MTSWTLVFEFTPASCPTKLLQIMLRKGREVHKSTLPSSGVQNCSRTNLLHNLNTRSKRRWRWILYEDKDLLCSPTILISIINETLKKYYNSWTSLGKDELIWNHAKKMMCFFSVWIRYLLYDKPIAFQAAKYCTLSCLLHGGSSSSHSFSWSNAKMCPMRRKNRILSASTILISPVLFNQS